MNTFLPSGGTTGAPGSPPQVSSATRWLRRLAVAAFALMPVLSQAQLVTIPAANTNGTGASASETSKPLSNYYGYERSAMLYLNSEVTASGSISSVGFYLNSVSSPAAVPVKIYLKDVAAATVTLPASTVASEETGATLVYNATIPASAFVASSWVTLSTTAITVFSHTSGMNLEVIVEANYGSMGTETQTAKVFRNTSVGSGGTRRYEYWQMDNTAPSGNGTRSVYLPNIQFNFATVPACTGTPTAGAAAASVGSFCAGGSSVISLTGGSTGVTGLNYQLQSSATSGGTYTNVGTAGTSSSFTVSPTASTYYRIVTTCTNSSLSANSTPVQVTVTAAPAYATLPYTETFETTWIDRCATRDVPASGKWSQTPSAVDPDASFRRYDDGASAGWTGGSTNYGYTPAGSNAGGASSSFSARYHSGNVSPVTEFALFDLYVNASGAGTPTLSFDYINTSGSDQLQVFLSTDGGASFGAALFTQVTNTAWTKYTLTLTGANATSVVRFKAMGDNGSTDIGLDNVSVALVNCAAPTGIAVSNLTTTTAQVSFTGPPSGVTNYTVTTTPATTQPNATGSPFTLTGLAPNTSYTVTLVTNCSGGNGSSAASTSNTFRTACPAPGTYAALPYTQSFEAAWASVCGTREAPDANWRAMPLTGDNSWRRFDDGTAATWTSTSGAYSPAGSNVGGGSSSFSARFHTYDAATTTQGLLDLYVNAGGAGTATLAFDYINTSGGDKLEVLLSADGGVSFGTPLFTQVASATWTRYTVTLTGASATSVVRFRATSDFGTTDIGLDNVGVSLISCAAPTGIAVSNLTSTTAQVSFTGPASGVTNYTVTTTPATTQPTATGSPFTLTGLAPNTSYTVTLVTNCSGGNGSSTASTSSTFKTLCPAPGTYATLPYTQNFEATWVNGCATRDVPDAFWLQTPGNDPDASFRRYDDGNSVPWTSTSYGYTPAGSNAGGASSSFSARYHSGNVFPVTEFALFDLYVNASGAGTPVLSFDYINTSGSDQLQVFLSTDGGVSFGSALFTQVTNTAWTKYTLTLTGATATSVIRFKAMGDNGSTDIGLDNVSVSVVTCAAPSGITFVGTTPTSTQVTFSSPGVGNTGYTVTATPTTGSPVTASGATSPIALTGLQPNTAYSVVVAGNCGAAGTSGTQSFTTPAIPPSNDECAGAISLTPGTTCAATTGTTLAATASTAAGTCAGTADDDVWYKFVATSTQHTITVVGGTNFDAVVNLRSGACPGVLVGSCADATGSAGTETITATTLTVGQTYYVRVYEYYPIVSGSGAPGSFTICVTVPADLLVTTGNSPYTSAAATFNNVTIANGGSLNMTGALTIAGTLTVQNGGTLNTTAGNFVLGAGNFDVQAGGTLGIQQAGGIIATPATTGAVRNTGSIRNFSNDATYVYNGAAAQTTGSGLPATVRNLTVNNSTGLTLSQALSVRQVARLQSGSLTTGSNGFTLLSVTGQGTALIDNTGGGTVIGTGTMQRAVDITTDDNIGYHHYASPMVSTTINDLQTPGFDFVLNPAFNTATLSGQTRPYPTVLGYDQARIATSTTAGYGTDLGAFDKGFFSPTLGDAMAVGRGYTANVPNALLEDFVGTFNNGPIAAGGTLTRDANATGQEGWQLLGNPYPSPLNWATVTAGQRVNLDAAAYVYHATSRYSGFYTTYLTNGLVTNGVNNVGTATTQTDPIIDAGAGFFARVTSAGTGALNLTNANRVTTYGNQANFGRQASSRPQLTLQLAGAGLSDNVVLYFDAAATTGVDAQYDATKLTNPNGLNLALLAGTRQLAIDALPAPTAATVVPMFVGVPVTGSFSLTVSGLTNFGSTTVYLRDALTGTRTLLAGGTTYRFTLTSYTAPGRFSLEFAPAGTALATAAQTLAAQVQLYPNPTKGNFHVLLPAGAKAMSATLLNALGQVVLTRSMTTNEADFTIGTTGVYTLRLLVDGTVVTRKVVVE